MISVGMPLKKGKIKAEHVGDDGRTEDEEGHHGPGGIVNERGLPAGRLNQLGLPQKDAGADVD